MSNIPNVTNLKPIGERLRMYMADKKIGLNQLGRMTGTSGAQIHNILNGKKYGIDKVLNICFACSDLNVLWLLFGIGEMLNDPFVVNRKAGEFDAISDQASKLEHQNLVLQQKVERLETQVNFQDMTIQAYKNSIDILNDSNKTLKENLLNIPANGRTGQ